MNIWHLIWDVFQDPRLDSILTLEQRNYCIQVAQDLKQPSYVSFLEEHTYLAQDVSILVNEYCMLDIDKYEKNTGSYPIVEHGLFYRGQDKFVRQKFMLFGEAHGPSVEYRATRRCTWNKDTEDRGPWPEEFENPIVSALNFFNHGKPMGLCLYFDKIYVHVSENTIHEKYPNYLLMAPNPEIPFSWMLTRKSGQFLYSRKSGQFLYSNVEEAVKTQTELMKLFRVNYDQISDKIVWKE